jgi:hypothetical protein
MFDSELQDDWNVDWHSTRLQPHYISISLAFEQAETTEKKSSGMAGWCRRQIFM